MLRFPHRSGLHVKCDFYIVPLFHNTLFHYTDSQHFSWTYHYSVSILFPKVPSNLIQGKMHLFECRSNLMDPQFLFERNYASLMAKHV